MKNLLFVIFLGNTFTTILAESHSMSCSMMNGKWTCREMSNPEGDSAFSSSVAFSGPGGDSTYEGVGNGYRGGFNWDQGGTGIFSGVNSPGGSRVFSGIDPYGGFGILSAVNPYGNDGISPGVNPFDGSDTFSDLNPPFETKESEDPNPSSDTDDSDVHPEVVESPNFNAPPGGSGFVPLPVGTPGTFATAGSGQFPGIIHPFAGAAAGFPFVGTGAFAGSPFGFPQAFAGARAVPPFINPVIASGIPRFPLGFPFRGSGIPRYAGRRR